MSRWPTTSVPKNTVLYHGTASPEDFDIPRGPAWFSNAEAVARSFMRWHGQSERSRVIAYRTTSRVPNLLFIDGTDTMSRFVKSLDLSGDPQELAEAVCDGGWNGWNIPSNYLEGSDLLLCEPERWVVRLDEAETPPDDPVLRGRDLEREAQLPVEAQKLIKRYAVAWKSKALPRWLAIYDAIEHDEAQVYEFLAGKT